jgi:hypothetical protein
MTSNYLPRRLCATKEWWEFMARLCFAVLIVATTSIALGQDIKVNSEKVGQLLCGIATASDIPAAMKKFGNVVLKGSQEEPEWELDTELFNISYTFSKDDDEGPKDFDILIHSTRKAGRIFENETEAEKWFRRLGLEVVRDATSGGQARMRAVAFPWKARTKTNYDWSTGIKTVDMLNLHVSWTYPQHASENSRFCNAFKETQ